MTYVITGATGHIGRQVAEALLRAGKSTRVVGRSKERLRPLVDRGAEAQVGSLDDGDFLARAFGGAQGVFAMIPPDGQAADFRAFQNRIGTSLATALKAAKVAHVVSLSSQGARLPAGTGPIAGLHDQEQRLNQMEAIHVVHLRPTFFMENLLMNVDLIRSQGINGSPVQADLAFPVIATADIAAAAVEHLLGLEFTGQTVHDLLGERDLSMQEMTRLLGKAIGKPDLPYVQFSYEDARKAMLAMGLSADVARLYVEMYQAINGGLFTRATVRTPANTTRTSFETFAAEFARLYAAKHDG